MESVDRFRINLNFVDVGLGKSIVNNFLFFHGCSLAESACGLYCLLWYKVLANGLRNGPPEGRHQKLSSIFSRVIKKQFNCNFRIISDVDSSDGCSVTTNLSEIEVRLENANFGSY